MSHKLLSKPSLGIGRDITIEGREAKFEQEASIFAVTKYLYQMTIQGRNNGIHF